MACIVVSYGTDALVQWLGQSLPVSPDRTAFAPAWRNRFPGHTNCYCLRSMTRDETTIAL
jgi:hypothetical protein